MPAFASYSFKGEPSVLRSNAGYALCRANLLFVRSRSVNKLQLASGPFVFISLLQEEISTSPRRRGMESADPLHRLRDDGQSGSDPLPSSKGANFGADFGANFGADFQVADHPGTGCLSLHLLTSRWLSRRTGDERCNL
jgi:hypothetical protein